MMKQPFNKFLAVFAITVLMQGCSSMNQSECIHADWQLIGQADASKGVHSSILDEYRHDCAEYAVVPAREAYHLGYQEGLKQFCTRSSGFFQGKKGSKYQGICPAALEEKFLQGYNPGYELFMISDVMTTLRATLSDAERDIRKLRKSIGKKEQLLISDKSTPADRKRLLGEIKAHHREIFWLQQDAEDSRFELLRKQSEYDRKVRSNTY
ncbi:DUF2799 domain-containing protein [Neptunomonas japonica]|uniref:DUF2799 domain-containing protein n=1 Tax=Neptunomonas japonica TaxID=417574 RepID=UPI00146AB512|nr:DUF2799 domain-containing protein [Neptunomonas japonica]